MKLGTLVAAQPAMKLLSETKLPVKVSFRVAKALQLAAVDLNVYEQERLKLLQELGVLSDDKNQYVFDSTEKMNSFYGAVAALQEEDLQVDLPLISVNDLGDIDLAPSTIFPLLGVLLTE